MLIIADYHIFYVIITYIYDSDQYFTHFSLKKSLINYNFIDHLWDAIVGHKQQVVAMTSRNSDLWPVLQCLMR